VGIRGGGGISGKLNTFLYLTVSFARNFARNFAHARSHMRKVNRRATVTDAGGDSPPHPSLDPLLHQVGAKNCQTYATR